MKRISPVQPDECDLWLSFASQVWTSQAKDLRERFVHQDFPYEFFYRRDGQVLAWMSLSIRSEYVAGASGLPIAYLEGIVVHPTARKQGIAAELLAFAKSWAKKEGCLQLASDCSLENLLSQAVHEQLGFREVERSVHYLLDVDI